MLPSTRSSAHVRPRDGWIAVAYFALYLTYLFLAPESELLHWVTLVALPLLLAWAFLPAGGRGPRRLLATVGLYGDGFWRGTGWALLGGLLFSALQFLNASGRAALPHFRDGSALYLFPLAFLVMLVLAGFTEELFFRGFVQTRLEALTGRPWVAVLATSLLFGVYHLPYALLNPHWPSYGHLGAAVAASLGNGVPGGLVLGGLYAWNRGRLPACIVLHALVDTIPAMTLIHFGGR